MTLSPNAAHVPARWWRMRTDGRIECFLCPRLCKLREGQTGFCHARRRVGNRMEPVAYGRNSGLCFDPVEKKPLNHFLPGTQVLSFGTAGCNLGCRFCQNWSMVGADAVPHLNAALTPHEVGAIALGSNCPSVAFTYNDPVVFAEYAIEVARACHAMGLNAVAVTAGYIGDDARHEFFADIDAANIDLKAFSDSFYRRLCLGRLQPVLDTLAYVHRHTAVWLEVTTLLIPGENDSVHELEAAADWFAAELGPDVPWHFTAYHPAYKFTAPPTPTRTLLRAREIALSRGLRYVYTGNVKDPTGSSTWCPCCGRLLIERDGSRIRRYHLQGNRCDACGTAVPGRFSAERWTDPARNAKAGVPAHA